MERIVIRGGRPLNGALPVSGAKNAALPIIAATVLTRGTTVLRRVPRLADVETICALLADLGVDVRWTGPHTLSLTPPGAIGCEPAARHVRRMRGSVCVLGPLLAMRGRATLPLPGGCVIGPRPIDLHLKGLGALGADFSWDRKQVTGRAPILEGARIDLAGPRGSTVLGTANVMMAATLARGRTIIEHAACEPEVQDLARYLNACGARIAGIGTRTLTIQGVRELHGVTHELIPDRIETGTFMVAAAVTGGRLELKDARPEHLQATTDVLRSAGVKVCADGRSLTVDGGAALRPIDLVTGPYPGLPTDMQPQLTTLLCRAGGSSEIDDRVYPERFTHVPGLRRMGAGVSVVGGRIRVEGGAALHGADVEAADLRAGAALVLAGLAADGTTCISGLDQIDRGYQDLTSRLHGVGAEIHREEHPGESRRRRPA